MKPRKAFSPWLVRPVLTALVSSLLLLPPARAFVFETGAINGTFDTTISVGGLYRLDSPAPWLYGLAAGGQQKSVNADDGDLNYPKGMASFLVKASHDLQLNYQNSGLFVRGYYFNDIINTGHDRARTPLSADAEKIVGKGGELLDAYAYFKSDLNGMPATLRFGRQVLSWGESTFIPNGVNSINPIDVAKLRTPGSELKEALLPLTMVSGSLNITEALSLEGFYLLDWQRTRIDPPGTYFSTNDFVAQGGSKILLGFGAIPDTSSLGAISRAPDHTPGNEGQYGVNLRWLAKNLRDTEFGFYFMNYHSRLPVISALTPTAAVNTAPVVAQIQSVAGQLASAQLFPVMITNGVPLTSLSTTANTLIGAALLGYPKAALPASIQPFYAQTQGIVGAALADPSVASAKKVAFLTAASSGRYLIEFPRNIELYGASFNTVVKGIALQGEISYRPSQPLQIDDVELLFAALSSLDSPGGTVYGANNQLGNYKGRYSTYVPGYRRHQVWTGQMTATRVGGSILGASQSVLLAEAGFVQAYIGPKSQLRYDGSGTFVGGNLTYMTNTGNGASGSEPASAFADPLSWGYQIVGRLDYNNLFAGVNVSPLFAFSHDVAGNTPLPLGNFISGRKSITIGAEFTYRNAWALDLRYVNYFDAGRYNLLSDRDFVSCNLKYSF